MKHCDKCNVNIADNINNCPLCGKDLSAFTKDENFVCYPNDKVWHDKRKLTLNILLFIALIGTVLCLCVDLFFNHRLTYSWYVITGCLIFVVDIYYPIKKQWSFSTISTIVGISVCLYILFLELFTHTFGWGVNYVIPFFILFMSCYSTIIVFIRNYYKGFEFVLPLIIFTILSAVTFVVSYFLKLVIWPSFSTFLASLTLLILVLIFKQKKVKQELGKSFFV